MGHFSIYSERCSCKEVKMSRQRGKAVGNAHNHGLGGHMEERWLSVAEIAVYLGVKKDTIYAWLKERRLPANKIGRLWKFNRNELDEWVRSGGSQSKSKNSDISPE